MHYTIIGNGVAGTEAALRIRQRYDHNDATIRLISDESDYFFSRTALMYAYMDQLSRRDLEPYERRVYDTQQIERIRDRVIDINADGKTLTLQSGKTLSYDKLLLALGSIPRQLNVPGMEGVEEGVVNFVRMQDLDECERLTWSTKEAVVVGGGLIGIELVECLIHHKIKTTFLIREPYFWPFALGKEEGRIVSQHLQDKGVRVIHNDELATINVDTRGRVKSINTSEGRSIPCQMLGITVGVQPNVAWLESCTTPPLTDKGICVNHAFESSLPDIYAAGDCAQIQDSPNFSSLLETVWYSSKRQGILAAQSMMGDPIHYKPPLYYNSSKFFHIEYTTVGCGESPPPGTLSLYRKMPDKPISQRIYYSADKRVLGFNMLGSRWDHTLLEKWVRQRRSIDYVRKNLHKAQYDVEFGRAKLDRMDEIEVEQ